jgi:hypothetical protein
MREAGRRWGDLGRHTPRLPRGTALSEAGFDVEPTVEANGDKPISPLSVAAEPHCVSSGLQSGRRPMNCATAEIFRFPAPKVAFGNRPSRRIEEA